LREWWTREFLRLEEMRCNVDDVYWSTVYSFVKEGKGRAGSKIHHHSFRLSPNAPTAAPTTNTCVDFSEGSKKLERNV